MMVPGDHRGKWQAVGDDGARGLQGQVGDDDDDDDDRVFTGWVENPRPRKGGEG